MTARGGSGTPSASTPSILPDDLFPKVFHASPVAMAITRMSDATFVDVNEAFRREIGYGLGEVVGRSALDLGLWVDPAERESMVRALRAHGSAEVTARFRVKSGEVLTGAFSARVIEQRGEGWILTTIHEPFERQVAELARRRRDAILDAVAFAAQHFLTTSGWEEDIQEVLERLGTAADVSRAYIFENRRAEDGTAVHSQRYEWAAVGIVPQIDAPFLQDFSFHDQGTGHWEAMLRRGEPVQGHARDLPEAAREVFWAQQIRSLLLVPVFVGAEWWGFIGFDECLAEQQWTTGETDALKAAAGMLGAAIGRQRAESLLRETEAKYRTLVEQIPAAIWIDALDEAMTTLYISPQIETLLGISPADYQADPDIWVRHLHPEDRDGAVAAYTRGRESGEPFSFEYRMIRPDGRVVWIREEAVRVQDEAGSPRFLQGVALDITALKEAEERLRAAEARYRTLVENMPPITYLEGHGEGATDFYISPRVEQILGYAPEEWGADPGFWYSLIHPEDVGRVKAANERANATEAPYSIEYRFIARDGRVVWVRDEAILLTGEAGGPRAWQGVMLDITERKLAEEQLRQAEARYRTLVENIPAVTYLETSDPNPVAFYMSPQVEVMLGYTPEDFRDPTFWDAHIHPDDRAEAVAREARSNATGEPYACEYRMVAADGRTVWIRDQAVLARDEGRPSYWQGVLLDITERKRAEAELQESLELLGRADRDRRMLLARVVEAQEEERRRIAADIHDDSLQKMAAVGLRLQTLHRQDLGTEGDRLLEQLEQTVELAIARLRHMMFELRPPALDRDGLAAALQQHLDEVAAEGGFEAHLENRLVTEPPRATRAIAYRIAQEALANVRKHAGAHRVDVLLESREGGLFVRIRDDGRGFSRADAESAHGHMGLSAMRERADLVDGWCRVEGAPGAGTTVELWLPAGAADGPGD